MRGDHTRFLLDINSHSRVSSNFCIYDLTIILLIFTSGLLKVPTMLENWFIFQNDRLLLIIDTNHFPTGLIFSQLEVHFVRKINLGLFNNINCYAAEIASDVLLPAEINAIPLRKAFELLGIDWFRTAAKAFSIINWDKTHQFCGRCGHKTSHKSASFERICDACGLSLYPRISPSVIVMIKNNDQILMARGYHFPPGAYGLIAGFVEAGENLEEAVHREVAEEVGIKIKNLQYFDSQAWPFPDSLMVGFTAEYASGELTIDHNEIEHADWYRYDNLPGKPSVSISIARKLIDFFVTQQEKQR